MTIADDMNAALAGLAAKLSAGGGLTVDQVNTQINAALAPQVATLNTALAAFQAAQTKDESTIKDLVTAVGEFTKAFTPTPAPSPAPAPTPAPAA